MVRCWICSIKLEVTTRDVYVCESRENTSDKLRFLEKTEPDERAYFVRKNQLTSTSYIPEALSKIDFLR